MGLHFGLYGDVALSPGAVTRRELLAAPMADAKELLRGRMPVPKLLETDQGGSQACHYMSPESRLCIVNPVL